MRKTDEGLVAVLKMDSVFFHQSKMSFWFSVGSAMLAYHLIASIQFFLKQLASESDVTWKKISCNQENKKFIPSSSLLEKIAHRRNQWDQLRRLDTSRNDCRIGKYTSPPFVTKVKFSKKIDFQLSMECNWKVLSMLGFNSAK